MAGFHYFLERHNRPPTASMTAAGICVPRASAESSITLAGSQRFADPTRITDAVPPA